MMLAINYQNMIQITTQMVGYLDNCISKQGLIIETEYACQQGALCLC